MAWITAWLFMLEIQSANPSTETCFWHPCCWKNFYNHFRLVQVLFGFWYWLGQHCWGWNRILPMFSMKKGHEEFFSTLWYYFCVLLSPFKRSTQAQINWPESRVPLGQKKHAPAHDFLREDPIQYQSLEISVIKTAVIQKLDPVCKLHVIHSQLMLLIAISLRIYIKLY